MQPIYLICGVPGSGKTWVCSQLQDRFTWVEHEKNYKNHSDVLFRAARQSLRPVITECPFAERALRTELEAFGIRVYPYFVVEAPLVVINRYRSREKKMPSQNVITRAATIVDRAIEWRAPQGTSEQMLRLLRSIPLD